MKRVFGIVFTALGLLIAIGPQFLFRVCDSHVMVCHWTAQAEIGIGAVIALLGVALIILADFKIQLGLSIGILLSGIHALLVPHLLIGGCATLSMSCNTTAFPAITVISILLLVGISFYILLIIRKISSRYIT